MGISRSSPLLKSVSGATFLGDWLRLLEEVHTPSSTCLPGTERRHWVGAQYRGGLLHPLQATPQETCSPAALRYMAEGLGSPMSRKGLELMLQPLLGEHTMSSSTWLSIFMNLVGNWIPLNPAPLSDLAEIALWIQELLGPGNDR